MKLLVGVTADDQGDDALALAEDVARAGSMSLVLCHVHREAWPVRSKGSVDAEWLQYLRQTAQAALDRARDQLSGDLQVETEIHAHASSGRGLAEVAQRAGAACVVIGSAPGGRDGRIAGGSTSDQLLHGSTVPVTLSPKGHRLHRATPSRVTVAYRHTLSTDDAVTAAGQLCRRLGVPLRLLTLITRPARLFPGAESALDEGRQDAKTWLDAARSTVSEVECSSEIAEGDDVAGAMGAVPFEPGELVVCGSSSAGPLARVFLGDTSVKILRASPVPVMVVPRGVSPSLEVTQVIPVVDG